MSKHQTIGVSIAEDILAKVDQDRGDVSRSRFLQRLLEQAYALREKKEVGSVVV
jgi:metal-responsive CopG/Arc/MetJ family transcriptional regulator